MSRTLHEHEDRLVLPRRVVTCGSVQYRAFGPDDLGLIPNPNCWIGDGWQFCPGCNDYTAHDAYAYIQRTPARPDCLMGCAVCGFIYERMP